MVAFPQKDWQNFEAGGTPVDEAGLDDLETRIANTFALVGGGGGITGAVETPVSVGGTLFVNSHNPVDASFAPVTMTLPSGMTEGTEVSIEKVDTTANTVTISGSIEGVGGQTATLTAYRDTVWFRADSTGSWWPLAGRRLPSQIDAQVRALLVADLADEDSVVSGAFDQTYIPRAELDQLGLAPIPAIRTSAKVRNNTASMQSDDQIIAALDANTVYRFTGRLWLEAAGTADFKCQWTVPTGATMRWQLLGPGVTVTGAAPGSTNAASPAIVNWEMLSETGIGKAGGMGVGTPIGVWISGTVTTGSTAGNLQLQWAQNAADATDTTLHIDSGITLNKVKAALPTAPPDTPPVGLSPTPLANGLTVVINSRTYKAQSPDKTYSLAVQQSGPDYSRHELRAGDKWTDGRERCELRDTGYAPFETDYWTSYSFRLNGAWPSTWVLITQFHQEPQGSDIQGQPPAFGCQFIGTDWNIYTRGDLAATTTAQQPSTTRWTGTRPSNGVWVNMVYRMRFSKTTANGQLQVWKDGTQLVNLSGLVFGYNSPVGPYFKHGMYRQGAAESSIIEFENVESGTTSLLGRVTTPLATTG